MTLEFSNLPLTEVSLRLPFSAPLGLGFVQYSAVRELLGGQGIAVSDLNMVDTLSSQGLAIPFAQLVGVRYTYPLSTAAAVDVHPLGLAVRWTLDLRKPYPRYAALRSVLERAIAALHTALANDAPPLRVANVAYSNLIMPPHDVAPSDHIRGLLAQTVFPELAAERSLHDLNIGWRDDSGIDLRYTLRQERVSVPVVNEDGSVSAANRDVITLTTSAGTFIGESDDVLDVFDRVHDALQPFFLSLLSDRALTEWGYASN